MSISISSEHIQEIVNKFGENNQDTGSTRVQIALLTARINHLTTHLKENAKDNSTRLGLLRMVGKRRRLLNYLMKSDLDGYRVLIKELGIRK